MSKQKTGDKIRRFREKHDLSFRQCAAKCGLSSSLIFQIENDQVRVTADTARKLAPMLRAVWHRLVSE